MITNSTGQDVCSSLLESLSSILGQNNSPSRCKGIKMSGVRSLGQSSLSDPGINGIQSQSFVPLLVAVSLKNDECLYDLCLSNSL